MSTPTTRTRLLLAAVAAAVSAVVRSAADWAVEHLLGRP